VFDNVTLSMDVKVRFEKSPTGELSKSVTVACWSAAMNVAAAAVEFG
jgi:hypothetical protein